MRKGYLASAVALALVSIGGVTAPVGAQPGGQNGYYLYEYTYYSDASHTESVGYYYEQCHDYAIGTYDQTPYYTRSRVGYYNYNNGTCTMY